MKLNFTIKVQIIYSMDQDNFPACSQTHLIVFAISEKMNSFE